MNLIPHKTILPILVLAAALQFAGLAADSLWGDEIFTAIFAAQTPAEVIAFTASDIHPPLYYLLVGAMSHTPLWTQGTPCAASDWLWRWPSAMMGVLTAAVAYRLGKTLLGGRIGLTAALLLAVSPLAVKYGQEARMHALFMFLSALSTLFLAQSLRKYGGGRVKAEKRNPQNRRRFSFIIHPSPFTLWTTYTIAVILNLYTMYFAFIIIAVHGAWVLAESYRLSAVNSRRPFAIRHSPLRPFAVSIALALLAYLPWWPILIKIIAFRVQVGAVEGGVGNPLTFLPKVALALGPILNLPTGPFGGVVWLFFGLYLLGLFFAWKGQSRRGQKGKTGGGVSPIPASPSRLSGGYWPLALLGGLWLALPALLPIVLGDSRALHLRYAFALPVYLIFVSLGLEGLAARLQKPKTKDQRQRANYSLFTIHYSLFTALLLFSLWGVARVYQQPKPDWRGAAAFVAEKAGPEDVILTGPLWDDARFFGYYYPYPDRVMPPPSLAFQLPGLAAEMAASGGKVWLVSRHHPKEGNDYLPHPFYGVWVMEPLQGEYDPVRLVNIGADFCKRAARQAEDWAATMEADGVLNPDPRSSKAAAYLCQGDTYAVGGDYKRALKPYQKMVEAFPGWADGYARLAKSYLAVDNVSSAVEAFQLAAQYNPNWQSDLTDRAAQLAAEGRWQEAAELYQEIIE